MFIEAKYDISHSTYIIQRETIFMKLDLVHNIDLF